MKKTVSLVMTIIIVLSFTITALAHSGRTDSKGGHNDNKNASGLGSYHYHHGYDEHLHPNGICPYQQTTAATTPTTTAAVTTPAPTPATSPAAVQEPVIQVIVSGEPVTFDENPEIINERVMAPIRGIVEKMGCTVEWDNNTQTVYINDDATPIKKKAKKSDEINVYVNNEAVVFTDQPPVNKNGRILIPVSFVVEKLGYTVTWDNETNTLSIDK